MTAQSRRDEICPICLDRRLRVLDFKTMQATVTLPRDCQGVAFCEREMRKPFDTQPVAQVGEQNGLSSRK